MYIFSDVEVTAVDIYWCWSNSCIVYIFSDVEVTAVDIYWCWSNSCIMYIFSDVEVTAVDIAPARDEVLICDFINVPIKSER